MIMSDPIKEAKDLIVSILVFVELALDVLIGGIPPVDVKVVSILVFVELALDVRDAAGL